MPAHFIRNHLSQRGLPQSGRSMQEHMIERFVTFLRGLDRNVKILHHSSLAGIAILLERMRTEICDEHSLIFIIFKGA